MLEKMTVLIVQLTRLHKVDQVHRVLLVHMEEHHQLDLPFVPHVLLGE